MQKPINQIIQTVMTETQALTTKEKPTSTEMQPPKPEGLGPNPYQFQTLHDPILRKMVQVAYDFEQDITNGQQARWLSFVGTSGTGKTFLASQIYKRAKSNTRLKKHQTMISPVIKVFWPTLLTNLRNQEYWHVADIRDANFVFIDEIAIEHDPSGFGKDKLSEILSARVGKWTLLTSNLNLEKLANIDTRISSRMIRGGSVVVECETVDFNLR